MIESVRVAFSLVKLFNLFEEGCFQIKRREVLHLPHAF